jgi:hypothetical protein
MRKKLLLLGILALLSGHDMYLKLNSYFLPPDTPVELHLYNGTFDKSENTITRDRMLDVSLVGQGRRVAVEASRWSERDSITVLNFTTGQAGTWVAGVSTGPRNIEMSAEDFNSYLEHDGVLDMLAWRRENNALEEPAVEKYSKHVKAIFQVGEETSEDWATVLGYPIEFIPLENPYDLHPGHTLGVKLLRAGTPLANQLVYVGFEGNGPDNGGGHSHGEGQDHDHDHDEGADHSHTGGTQVRTDEEGIARVFLPAKGTWYLRTIHLVRSEDPGLTHESNWATLTFGVGDGHSHSHATGEAAGTEEPPEAHDAPGEGSTPSNWYWLGGILVLAALYFTVRRKKP